MRKFKFEIQGLIKVEIEADSPNEARASLINNLDSYAEALISDAYVSDGKELKLRDKEENEPDARNDPY